MASLLLVCHTRQHDLMHRYKNLGTTKGRKHNIYLSGTDLIGSSPASFIHFLKNDMSLSPFHARQIFHCVAVPVPHLLHPFLSVGSMTELLWLALTLMFKYCCDVLTWRLWGKYPVVAQLSHMEALLLVVRGVAILTYLVTRLGTSPPAACRGSLLISSAAFADICLLREHHFDQKKMEPQYHFDLCFSDGQCLTWIFPPNLYQVFIITKKKKWTRHLSESWPSKR